jgi:hypothetical protein
MRRDMEVLHILHMLATAVLMLLVARLNEIARHLLAISINP